MKVVSDVAVATQDRVAPGERGQTRASARRSWRSLLALHPAWLVVAASCALLARATVHQGLNTDVFWHLAAGDWMLAHHSVIRHDVFSYTVHGRPWVAEEWGFEVLLAWMVQHVGQATYWLVSGGACVLALVATTIRARLLGADVLWVAGLSILLSLALLIGLAPRPQDLSYFFFALELLLLTVARRHRLALLALPPLLLLWCNIHGSFLAGIIVLALEAVLAVRPKLASATGTRRGLFAGESWAISIRQPLALRDALATLVVGSLVTLANPHGLRLWSYAVSVTTAAQLNGIEEWQSPNFHSLLTVAAMGVPMLVVVVILATRRVETNVFDFLVWLGFTAASLHAVRFIPYMGIAFVGVAAPWVGQRRETIRRTLVTWPATLVCCALLMVGSYRPAGRVQPGAAPVASVNWLQHRSGRVFSTYAWNDYLIARHIPVFVDGRTDLYFGTSVLSTYEAVSGLSKLPDPVFRRWHVRWVIWPAHSPLALYLAEDPGWRLAKRFGKQEIFERV